MTEEEKRLLQDQGYLIVRAVMDPAWLAELQAATARLLEEEGTNAGREFRKEAGSDRLANLVDKGECFQRLVSHPLMLEAAEVVFGWNRLESARFLFGVVSCCGRRAQLQERFCVLCCRVLRVGFGNSRKCHAAWASGRADR